ncbi:MAG TPA: SPW repeat protein [Thermoanaerobaculia bacterium]|nr:SPW repeat protein [Thermoanaerobaculia bacterium]
MAEPTPRRKPGTGTRPARPWTDWVNALAGLWLFLSPWAMAPEVSSAAAWNAWIFGLVITLLALASFTDRRAQWGNAAAGFWVFISPWALTYQWVAMAWNAWIVGAIVTIVALSGALSGARRGFSATIRA